MAGLILENISRTFAATRKAAAVSAVKNVSLEVRSGELVVLLGPSGCGKTTLLRMIAGLDQPDSGRIILAGEDLSGVPPQKRRVGMAFQYPALLPQLTVEQNISLGAKLRKRSDTNAAIPAHELAGFLGGTEILTRMPETLSGGQQQRVSLARAVSNRPALLLLDEPLANLDPVGRDETRVLIRELQQQLRLTTLYVTHDQSEAAALADRIALMRDGSIVQVGSSMELYSNPQNLFVAQFFGPYRPNVLRGTLKDARFHPQSGGCSFATLVKGNGQELGTGAEIIGAIRSRAIQAGDEFASTVRQVHHTGWTTFARLDGGGLILDAELPPTPQLRAGDSFGFSVDPADVLLFDGKSGERIR